MPQTLASYVHANDSKLIEPNKFAAKPKQFKIICVSKKKHSQQ